MCWGQNDSGRGLLGSFGLSGHGRAGEALSHPCFCCHFPLLSSQQLVLGTGEAFYKNSPHSVIFPRRSTVEKKGLLVFKHSPPLLCFCIVSFLPYAFQSLYSKTINYIPPPTPPREIGTIIRSLGCCPSEGELHDLIAEVSGAEEVFFSRLG